MFGNTQANLRTLRGFDKYKLWVGIGEVVMTVPAVAATTAPTPGEAATAPRRPPRQVKLQQH